MLIETDEYIDAAEAARMLGIKRARMSQLCTEGRFAGMVRIGHFWILPRDAVTNFQRLPPGVKKRRERMRELIATALAENVTIPKDKTSASPSVEV